MRPEALHPRFATAALERALADTPVVLIHGPRQCGKTTLAQTLGSKRGYAYFSFDDTVTMEAATSDPVGFVADLPGRGGMDASQYKDYVLYDGILRAPLLVLHRHLECRPALASDGGGGARRQVSGVPVDPLTLFSDAGA